MKEKLMNLLGGVGMIIYYILSFSYSILPFVMIGTSFWVTLILFGIVQFIPVTSIIFWIWGLICAINGRQDIWAYLYYVTAVVIAIPMIFSSFLDLINLLVNKK